MSGSVGKRERRKPETFNPADFDSETADAKYRRRTKETEASKKAKSSDEAFEDINEDPGNVLKRRISVSSCLLKTFLSLCPYGPLESEHRRAVLRDQHLSPPK